MKTRRDFLATMGLGAGASLLGLPEVARACGWGRRRARSCCSTCGGVYGECACTGLQYQMGYQYQPAPIVDTSCTCCCPMYLYATGNNIWYYYCKCCDGTGYVFAPSDHSYSTPYPTCASNPSQCIGSGCAKSSPGAYQRVGGPFVYGKNFFLDPKADDPPKKKKHADAFINGGKKVSSLKDMDINDIDGKIAHIYKVRYDGRYALLYEFTGLGGSLFIGFEVSYELDDATAVDTPIRPNKADFPYYIQVVLAGNTYHVVMPKKA